MADAAYRAAIAEPGPGESGLTDPMLRFMAQQAPQAGEAAIRPGLTVNLASLRCWCMPASTAACQVERGLKDPTLRLLAKQALQAGEAAIRPGLTVSLHGVCELAL